MTHFSLANPLKQTGLTLVELLIAMVLGLVLTGAAIQSFLAVKDSNRVMSINSEMQENGRFGMWFLTREIQMAGFREDLTTDPFELFTSTGSFGEGEVIRGTEGGTDSDSFQVRYTGYTDTMNQDCVGSAVATGSVVTVEYSVDASGNLVCSVNGGDPTIMVSGVDSLQVLYGEDLPDPGDVNSYVEADAVSDWFNVYSVRVGALIASNSSTASIDNTRTFDVLGESITASDDRVRQVFTMTVGLKNRIQ